MIPALVAPPSAQPVRDGGQVARGGGQQVRGGGQLVRGPRDGILVGGPQPRCYAFLGRTKAESCDAIITFSILGQVVSSYGIKVGPNKIEAFENWPRPTSSIEMQSFLGLAGYYRCFMEGFSSILSQLTKFSQKGTLFKWPDKCEEIFHKLKTVLTASSMLVLPTCLGSYNLYCDALHIRRGMVLMHDGRVIVYAYR
nr:uncharacterized mitochondrial protein AtMg00860-like [Nicotiana tomentosiformis]